MHIDLKKSRKLSIEALVSEAKKLGIDNAGNMRRSDLVFEIVCKSTSRGKTISGEGILEILSDGFGFLRSPVSDYGPGTDDIYVSPAQIRRFNLRTGDIIEGKARIPREGERYLALLQIEKVNGIAPEKARNRLLFETLPAREGELMTGKVATVEKWLKHIDMRYGQRVLIEFPKSMMRLRALCSLCKDIDAHIVYFSIAAVSEDILLLSQQNLSRFISAMGDGSTRHLQVANLALMHAKRVAESNKNVIFIFDSVWEYLLAAQEQVEQQGKKGAFGVALSMFRYFWGSSKTLSKGSLSIFALLPQADFPLLQRCKQSLYLSANHVFSLNAELMKYGLNPPIVVGEESPDVLADWHKFFSE